MDVRCPKHDVIFTPSDKGTWTKDEPACHTDCPKSSKKQSATKPTTEPPAETATAEEGSVQ